MRGENCLAHLLIKCRECLAIVDTGISMDFESFCSSELENNIGFCHSKSCGKELIWRKDDVLAISFCKI